MISERSLHAALSRYRTFIHQQNHMSKYIGERWTTHYVYMLELRAPLLNEL